MAKMANEKTMKGHSTGMLPVTMLALGTLAVIGWRCWPLIKGNAKDTAIHASGTIEATEIIVSPKIPGRIISLHVDEGSIVVAGAPIADLEATEVRAQANAAAAALGHAPAQWDEA